MNRPTPLTITLFCVIAASLLLYTIVDVFANKTNKRQAASMSLSSDSVSAAALFAPTPKYNPKHGQKGHRCDIPDGALMPQSAAFTNTAASLAKPSNTTALPSQFDLSSIASTAAPSNAAGVNPAHGQPGHRCGVAVGAPLNSAPAPAAATTPASTPGAALNPEHGKPGHRCDIAVGAPLNSTPAATNKTNAITTATTTTTTNATQPATKPGMNPAHGQPGHRCDIAVGAPLNGPSPVAPKAATPKTSPFPTINEILKPTANSSPAQTSAPATDSSGALLNPAHGQPGHDCTIAVGKPLKK